MPSPARALNRRTFVTLATGAVAGLPAASAVAAALVATPRQTAGPFYPEVKPLDSDADLVRVAGQARQAAGTETHVLGRVLDPAGRPVTGALVEIWQCDAHGRYHHPADMARGGSADPGVQATAGPRRGATAAIASAPSGRWPIPAAPRTSISPSPQPASPR